MNKQVDSRKAMAIVLVLIGVLIIVIMIVSALNSNKKNTTDKNTSNTNNTVNYETTTDGSKVNTSSNVSADKTVENVKIEQTKIVFKNGISTLTSKVTNNGDDKTNLQYDVTFKAADGTVLGTSIALVGNIKKGETRYVESGVTKDVSNAASVEYKIK